MDESRRCWPVASRSSTLAAGLVFDGCTAFPAFRKGMLRRVRLSIVPPAAKWPGILIFDCVDGLRAVDALAQMTFERGLRR
jgi:hypothetical protein